MPAGVRPLAAFTFTAAATLAAAAFTSVGMTRAAPPPPPAYRSPTQLPWKPSGTRPAAEGKRRPPPDARAQAMLVAPSRDSRMMSA
ncbi:hypothetical protein GCM10009837_43470 [Streptomyces durmitorensis]